MSRLADLRIEGGGWDGIADAEDLAEAACSAALAGAEIDPSGYAIGVLLTDDAEVASLNERFRGRASATNVLSWPAFPLAPRSGGAPPPAPPAPGPEGLSLGDVALAGETVRREADESGLAFRDHAAHLIVHGVLHLLGYDHERDADATLMEDVERRALGRIGVANPYA
jgi:probable rRNA maturation factor